MDLWEQIEGGLWGLLVGDAAGVPYEFREPWELPPRDQLGPQPPAGFVRSYRDVPLGTWSDDGAQALCLLTALLEHRGALEMRTFGSHMHAWILYGEKAVDKRVFDVGIQTGQALSRLGRGTPPEEAGLGGERNNGNGSLMRVLPIALMHEGTEAALVKKAHTQSCLTHRHPRSLVCCAQYCLWAWNEMNGRAEPWDRALATLQQLYADQPVFEKELHEYLIGREEPDECGSGYVVDCLLSARLACRQPTYAEIIREAIAYGKDTDTTACVAGGVAGIRHGVSGIPDAWRKLLRGREILDPLMEALWAFRGRSG